MDVSATGPAAAAAVPQANTPAITGTVSTSTPDAAGAASSNVPAAPSPPVFNTSAQTGQEYGAHQGAAQNQSALAPAIAKLFAVQGPDRLNVSYRVELDSRVIVTVFTDPSTGQEVAQFPPEVLNNLAQFFDQPRGATLDQNA